MSGATPAGGPVIPRLVHRNLKITASCLCLWRNLIGADPDGSPVHVAFPGHQIELESVDGDEDRDDNLWGMLISSGDPAPANPNVVTRAGWWNDPLLAHAQAKTWLVETEAD